MFTAKIENSSGQSLTLSQNEQDYQIISITGLNPPKANINMTAIAGMDGSKFNSSKINTRNIVITLKLNGDVEANRLALYQMFRVKEPCTFYYQTESRNVFINGYVETVEVNLFSRSELMQISIICPYPYFKSMATIVADISDRAAAFVFPFSINIGEPIPFSVYVENRETGVVNDSESETGVTVQIDVLDSVNKIQIKNTNTQEAITLQYSFQEGDKITINTQKGSKSVQLTREGEISNIFSALQQGSVFFQLHPGVNPFTYLVDNGTNDDDVFITFNYSNSYRGV